MITMEWREDFETGNPAVDCEHRELVDLLNERTAIVAEVSEPEEAIDFPGGVNVRISGHFRNRDARLHAVMSG